ncbi:MAG: flagellar protein FlaG [bacterium]|nr:flagellar protein FlaG [bacterium]
MGIQSVAGQQEVRALVPLSAAPAPPDGAQKSAPKVAAKAVESSTEPKKEQVRQSAQASVLAPPDQRAGTRMRVDEATDRVVTQIVNASNEVIKQIPPEELLRTVANVRKLQGLLFDQKV